MQVIVHLVTFTMSQLSHVTHVCLATSRQTEDLGSVLHVLVECSPGAGEPPNAIVSEYLNKCVQYRIISCIS